MIDDIYITGDDLKRIYQKRKKKIWRFAVFGALLILAYFLAGAVGAWMYGPAN